MSTVVSIQRHGLAEGDVVRRGRAGPLMLVSISDAEIDDLVMVIWTERRRLRHERMPGKDLTLVARP